MEKRTVRPQTPAPGQTTPPTGDGTAQLLRWGGWTIAAGVFFALLTKFAFGGIGEHGPQSSAGWLSLIVAMMCLPFGSMLFLLGAAKWLRNHGNPGRR